MFRSFLRVSIAAVSGRMPASRPVRRCPAARPLPTRTRPLANVRRGAGPGARDASPEPKAYDKVITKQAKSDPGLFTVHRIKDKVFYEIPDEELGKEFLRVSQIARTTLGVGYGGQAAGYRVVRWERRDNRVLLRSVSYDIIADTALPIAQAVQAANYEPILMSFNVEALGGRRRGDRRDAAVHDRAAGVQSVRPASARAQLRRRRARSSSASSSFPENVEVEATHTYTVPPDAAPAAGGRPRRQPVPPPPLRPAATACSCTGAW